MGLSFQVSEAGKSLRGMAVTIFRIAVMEVSVRGELGEFSTGNFRSAVTGEPETTFDARHADLARGRRGRSSPTFQRLASGL